MRPGHNLVLHRGGGIRFVSGRAGVTAARLYRVLPLAVGLVEVQLLQQAAEPDARLVYEFGMGRDSGPGIAVTKIFTAEIAEHADHHGAKTGWRARGWRARTSGVRP